MQTSSSRHWTACLEHCDRGQPDLAASETVQHCRGDAGRTPPLHAAEPLEYASLTTPASNLELLKRLRRRPDGGS